MNYKVGFAFVVTFLFGCSGGGDNSAGNNLHSLGGNLSGLTGNLSLQNNGQDTLQLSSDGTFAFSTLLATGTTYNVTVSQQPDGQTCAVSNASGTMGDSDISDVSVVCVDDPTSFSVGGSVSGLAGTLSLQNNGQDTLQLSSDGTFAFSTLLATGTTYNITVSQQPLGQTCVVSNGSGTMDNSDIVNVSVICANNPSSFTVGGTVLGITSAVSITNNGGAPQSIAGNGAFSLNGTFSNGQIYNVQIAQAPTGQVCSVANSSGQIASSNVDNISITCSDIASTSVTISGSYTLAPSIKLDIDVNDPLTGSDGDNDSFNTAQIIENSSTVQGFASEVGTGFSGDRFQTLSDEFDVFQVELQANQTARLQVVDFAGVDLFTGDLDLYLYDQNLNLVDSSFSTTEFEVVTAPSSGSYYIVVQAFSGTSKYSLTLASASSATSSPNELPDFIPNEAIIKFKPSTSVAQFKSKSLVTQISNTDKSRASLAKLPLNQSFGIAGSTFMQALKQANPNSHDRHQTLRKIKELRLRDDVEYAEPNYIRRTFRVPNDEFYSFQWHYPAINLPQAWDITTGSRAETDVIVSVIDTGVYLAHPDFTGKLVDGYDFISNPLIAVDGDGIDDDPDDPGDGQDNPLVTSNPNPSSWHGTHVSGTIAARSNEEVGVAGVSWDAKIMPLRALGAGGGTSYDILQSVRFSAGMSNDSGTIPPQVADIINMSLGGGGYSQAEQDLYNQLYTQGVIVVAAAGNENSSQLSYPASYDGVISVSAMDFNNLRAPYSNFGVRIDVGAPGGNTSADENQDSYADGILSAVVDPANGIRKPAWKFYQGTSMASPHVAGVLALMRAVHPAISPSDIDTLLAAGKITQDLGTPGRDDIYGHGFIDALKAVQEAQALAAGGLLPPQPALIVASPNSLALGLNSTATINLSNQGGETASITSTTTSAGWLSATPVTVDSNGLGDYQVNIDRSGLANSRYTGLITFDLSTGSTLEVQVTMQVGTTANTSSVGEMYILLLDSNNATVKQVSPVDVGNGVFNYAFTDVAPNTYRILGGTDIDNDFVICQYAEACGGFPSLGEAVGIEITNQNLNNIDFTVDILSSFSSLQSAGSSTQQPVGFSRLPRLKQLK